MFSNKELATALEHLEMGEPDISAENPPAVTPVAAPPKIDPMADVAKPEIDLKDDEKIQIFLFMLKKYMGTERFVDIVSGLATDMEVYGMIDDAEKVKVALQCIGKHHENDRWLKPVAMAAIKMAVAEGSDAGKRYLEADKAQQIALGEIMEQYGDDAKRAIRKLLQDNQRRAMTMNGAASRTLQEAIGTIADHI